MDLATLLSGLSLRDRERALLNVRSIAERASSGIVQTLPMLLADSPDPDTALNYFERLIQGAAPDLLRLLDRQRFLLHYALATFAYSPYLGDTLIQNPDLFRVFAREHNLDRGYSVEEYRSNLAQFRTRSLAQSSHMLACFKRREYVRIMLRDALGIATLAETTAEISALADALIEAALYEAQAGHATRPKFPVSILSLGKLGGNELNYSSDVDLLFLYDDRRAQGETDNSGRSHAVRLAQQVMELLTRLTPDGPVFRIDLRLRPQGSEGEPAVGLHNALRYYADTAHDWELQAMIKARHTAGDEALSREFLRAVQPFVYREELNFAAIETALATRRRMAQRRAGGLWARRPSHGIDVKVGRGGIRDIEFLVQCLQRVYGGSEPWLRSRGTLFALQKLHDKGHLSGKDFHELSTAYEFLRDVEHRLQLRHGQQTHRIPESTEDRQILSRSIALPEPTQQAGDIVDLVQQRMATVAEIYNRIIHQQQTRQTDERVDFQLASPSPSVEVGAELSYQQIVRRLADDSPELHAIATARDLDPQVRRNLHRFFSSALTSSDRWRMVLDHPRAVDRALALFGSSEFLTDLLVQHPEEIAALEPKQSQGAGNELLFEEDASTSSPAEVPAFAAADLSYSDKLALLRRRFRHRLFRAGALDVSEGRDVYSSLAETSAAAWEAISAALHASDGPAGFGVLALGRLGTLEFDLASDADLIFIRDESIPAERAIAAAERLIHALAAYTSDGTVFSVDARLRPHGAEGELVITPEQLQAYFASEAQPWEALTYTKLRPLAGDACLAERAMHAARELISRFARDPKFLDETRNMRTRLEESGREPSFKTIRGGFYDIDFLASYLLITNSGAPPRANIRETLTQLAARGLLNEVDRAALDGAAELLRTVEHVIRVVLGRPRKWLPTAERARSKIEELVNFMLHRQQQGPLQAELDSTFAQTRAMFDRLLAAQ